ncbi:hypothetical protein [Nonomuraea sp. NPDC049684]|uniref:hypothetical protein n=1 Tax=unclassified Nonomuraea TaxID=2593643 RepID=UPI003795F89F
MTASDHHGLTAIQVSCVIALIMTRTTATTRAQVCPTVTAMPVRSRTIPNNRWIQPQVPMLKNSRRDGVRTNSPLLITA